MVSKKNTIFETIKLRTKRLELLRDYSHFCLREDCLPISTCSSLFCLFSFQLATPLHLPLAGGDSWLRVEGFLRLEDIVTMGKALPSHF